MVRCNFLALFAFPLALAIACGSDETGPNGGEGGASNEGGAGPSDAGQGADAGGPSSTGGHAGAGGDSGTGGSTGSGGTSGGVGGEGNQGASAGAGGSGGESLIEIELTVTTNASVQPISPLIYGVNPAHGVTCSNATARFTLCRLGGNPWSTYNWENNASNAGADSDLCSENNAALGTSNDPADTVIDLVTEVGPNATAVVTVPILDYVAADKTAGAPYPLCSGDVRKSPDYVNTRMRRNKARKGAAFADPPDVSDAEVSQDEFLSYLKARSGTTKLLFTLDNHPELWGQTHIAFHPLQTTYDEVVARDSEFAAMIRDNWPGAEISGYGGYGYQAFLNLQNAVDTHDVNFIDWYLASMEQASDTAGERLIDYLDIHWYSVIDPATPETRVQAPRSLWDPDYVEGSWIGGNYGAIRLIPWMQEKITAYYPGTKLAISSYAYGGVDEISGGVAVADVLGIFGREGVSMAALEPEDGNNTFSVAAFAAFRNYDGAGASFGDQSVRATSSDVANVSVYASTDSQVAGKVVIVAINRSSKPSPVRLAVEDSASFTSASVYVLSSVAPELRPADALSADGANSFPTTLPAYSVSVIVPKP